MNEKIAPITETDGSIKAEAYFETVEPGQWPRGVFYPDAYVLLSNYEHVTPGRKLSSQQEELGAELARKLRERMLGVMRKMGWQEINQTRDGKPIWRHQPAMSTAQRAQVEQKNGIAPSQVGEVQSKPILRYTRPVTFTCQWCRQEVTEQRFPSHTPLYCSKPVCKKEATRAKAKERVAAWRKAHPDARRKKK